MATVVGLAQSTLSLSQWPTRKTPYLAQEFWWYLIYKLRYSQFSVEIYHFWLLW